MTKQKVIGGDCPKCSPAVSNTLWSVPCPAGSANHEHFHCDRCKHEFVWNPLMQEWTRYRRGRAVEVIPKRAIGVLGGAKYRRVDGRVRVSWKMKRPDKCANPHCRHRESDHFEGGDCNQCRCSRWRRPALRARKVRAA